MGWIKRFAAATGLDPAISATVLMRLISAVTGLITLTLVGSLLSKSEQGYYFTFQKVLSLQVFLELGLSFVILQSASHEVAQLKLDAFGKFQGRSEAKGRLADLFRLLLRWYSGVSILLIALLLPVGFRFFGQGFDPGVHWQQPWALLTLCTAAYVVVSGLFSYLEGCGFVADIAWARLAQTIAGSLAIWLVLGLHWGLYAVAANFLLFVVAGFCWVVSKYRVMLYDLALFRSGGKPLSWREEILPFQWRIAVSWLCGFFISELFTPILMQFRGPVEAGQMGMVQAIIGPLSGMSMAWISTKVPRFGNLVALRDYGNLDKLFYSALIKSVVIMVIMGGGFCASVALAHSLQLRHHDRLLDSRSTILLVMAALAQVVVYGQASYLRAHKVEPFLWVSIATAISSAAMAFLLARPYGALGIAAGSFLISTLVSLGLGTWVFISHKHKWQSHGAPAKLEEVPC